MNDDPNRERDRRALLDRTYLITYRIIGGPKHGERGKQLKCAIDQQAIGETWACTTSASIVRSKSSAHDLGVTLTHAANLDDADRLFIVEITGQPNARFGLGDEDVLNVLLPRLKTPKPDDEGGAAQA